MWFARVIALSRRVDLCTVSSVSEETWMVVVQPETGPRARAALTKLKARYKHKETCFGFVVEGEGRMVRDEMRRLRDTFPGQVYTKRRGFSIADTVICASTFSQLKKGDKKIPWKRRALAGQLCAIS